MNGIRHDRAVIMARGQSRRMGMPKGLLRLDPAGDTFLGILTALYGGLGVPGDVVALAGTADRYRAVMPAGGKGRVLAAEPGGDTALTVLIACRTWRADKIAWSHVWAHPVDLPLVRPATLELLRDISRKHPDKVIRPVWEDNPGHPVLLPASALIHLESCILYHDRPLRDYLDADSFDGLRFGPELVPVGDPGVARDFDRPEDLAPFDDSFDNGEAP